MVSTTSGWNPGDDFIREGVIKLVETALKANANWFFYNRNPDLDGVRKSPASCHVGTNNLMLPWDMVVFAGTPEWDSWRTKPLIEHLLTRPELPVLFLGIGSCNPGEKPGPEMLQLMQQDRSLVVCRNVELCTTLSELDVKSFSAPCPALFCQPSRTTQEPKGKVLIFQSAKCPHGPVPEMFEQSMLAASERGWSLLAHAHAEAFSAMRSGVPCFFDATPSRILEALASAEIVVSTRLHGAIAAASAGVPAIVTSANKNFRIRAAASLLGLPMVNDPTEAMTIADKMLLDGSAVRESIRLKELKQKAFANHVEIIRQHL